MYDGTVRRTLVGDEITERALIGSALNIDTDLAEAGATRPAAQ